MTEHQLQRTLARPASVPGRGYWSGQAVHVTFQPTPAHHGIQFARTDLPGSPRIRATADARVEIPRRTCLKGDAAQVDMVEHVMAALAGLAIDQCLVEVDGQEIPGCDGSSQEFVEAILNAGIQQLDASRKVCHVRKTIRVGDEHSWVEAQPVDDNRLCLKYNLSYDADGPIGDQSLEYRNTPTAFRQELAPARTFILAAEAEWLQSQGLGAGVTTADLLVFGPNGPIDNALRFEDECVRHKTLDLMGDLALSGCDWVGKFVSYRSGHRLNAELVRMLLSADQDHRLQTDVRRTA